MWRARHVASCAAAAWIGSRASATPGHPALKHGTPISHRTRYDENYVVHFDQRTRDPLWVVERLTKQRLDAEALLDRDRRAYRLDHLVRSAAEQCKSKGEVCGGEAGLEDESGEGRVEGHAEGTDVFGGSETALGVYEAVRVRRVGGCGGKDG